MVDWAVGECSLEALESQGTRTEGTLIHRRAGKGQALHQHWLSPIQLLGLSGSQLFLLSSVYLSVSSYLCLCLPELDCPNILTET